MIVLKRLYVLLAAIFAGFTILGFGAYGYRLIGVDNSDAEMFLYLSIVAAIGVFLLFLIGVIRAEVLDRRLNRIIHQGTRRDIVPERDFQALGSLGEKLGVIFQQVSRQSALKTRKIGALHDLVEFLVRNIGRSVAICDVVGSVRYASEEWAERMDSTRLDAIGENVSVGLPGLSVNELASKMIRTRQPEGARLGDRDIMCYPIEDGAGELAYIILFIDAKARFFEKRERKSTGVPKRSVTWPSGLVRLFSRKG